MEAEISVLQVEKRIRSRVKRQMEKTQREYYLNEQMKAIQKSSAKARTAATRPPRFEARIKKTKLSKEAREKAEAEIERSCGRCRRCRLNRPSFATISTGSCRSVGQELQGQAGPGLCQNVLDTDHFGLDKVKDRIVEYLRRAKPPGSQSR